MLRNYFKIALRSLVKDKVYTALNIVGLAIGMACCLLIALYVWHERSFDRWIPDYERIHRVAIDITTQQGDHLLFAPTSGTLAEAVQAYPEVEVATRVLPNFSESLLVTTADGQARWYESGWYLADPNLFSVFPYPLVEGDPATALNEPYTVVIAEDIARRYFGEKTTYLEETLVLQDQLYRIKGVLKSLPETTSFRPNIVASLRELEGNPFMENWHATVFHTFIKTKRAATAGLAVQIANVADQYVGEEIKENSQQYRYFLQPLASIHLHSDLKFELSKNNDASYLHIFTLVAAFILFIAGINFVNLATARATRRAKEVGVRKVSGARRGQLMAQFMGESLLLSFVAILLAFVLVQVVLPVFNLIADKEFIISQVFTPGFLLFGFVVAVLVGSLAGIYPAWYLARFKPAVVFQDKLAGNRSGGAWLRNSLVVGQFAVSIFIIVAALVVSSQLSYLQNQNLGFDQEQMLVIHAPGSRVLEREVGLLRETLGAHAAVSSVSATGTVPGKGTGNNLVFLRGDHSKSTNMQLMQIDEKFLETYDIPLLAGRNISEALPSDTAGSLQSVLINEACLPVYGWRTPEEAIGKEFDNGWGKIVGVVKDFHYTSLQTDIAPLEMYFNPRRFEYLTLKINTQDLTNTLAALEQSWNEQVSSHPFTYFFLDDAFNRQYSFEMRLGKLFSAFSLLAILIACLGLFGLGAYAITQRTKEIGIRKVLGASVTSVVALLSKDFLKLVGVALLIATPLAWYVMHGWLENFAFRVGLSWWIFALAGGAAIGIAFLTISLQSIKAALANPVESLRSE